MAQLVSKVPVLANRALTATKPKLELFLKYAKVELTPPTPADIPQIRAGIGKLISGAKNGNWKNTTVKDAWINTLVSVEVLCWFYVGEVIEWLFNH
ncbi:hypothetical protein GWI33_013463 [Rhynchophorus ferrugineus]|uniref:ATP synthase subunit g n=1 Tax=Rhynchophorus ferrugineus TaxID=354439 RepID=A0A834I9L3_RHYFE|nr:hypothetical protein GWI33_013463 [Rhynchophorus ferrugineus]